MISQSAIMLEKGGYENGGFMQGGVRGKEKLLEDTGEETCAQRLQRRVHLSEERKS